MKRSMALCLLTAFLLAAGVACDSTRASDGVNVSDDERQTACDALGASGSTAKLVQAGATLDTPRSIDATGAPRTVVLSGDPDARTGYVAVNVNDAAFLLLIAPGVPVEVTDAQGHELAMAEATSSPSWCEAAGQSKAWRADAGETSILALGPTPLNQVVLVLSRVDQDELD